MIGAAHRRRRPVQGRWRLLAVVLTLAGVGCLMLWANGTSATSTTSQQTRPQSSPSATEPSATRTSPADAAARGDAATVAPETAATRDPVHLAIPRIGVSTSLIQLGLQPDRTVEVPQQPELAGWYRLGPRPGDLGSAVLLGHVDSVDGPAVFAKLPDLEAGDEILVRREDGSEVTFRVRTVTTYANEDFPAQLVYGSLGEREVNLVTCGGEYDADRGGYQANVVVNALRV